MLSNNLYKFSMMKLLTALLFTLLTSNVIAQDVVTNTDWNMDEAGEKVIITYDLNKLGEFRYFDIKLFAIIDGVEYPPKSISGDVGTYQRVGRGKTIVWDIFKDIMESPGEQLSFKVVATNSAGSDLVNTETKPDKEVNTFPIWTGLAPVVAGGPLLITGLTSSSNAKSDNDLSALDGDGNKLYDDYGDYDDAFNDLNKKYKNGQLLMVAGAGAVAFGAFQIIRNAIDKKKIQNRFSQIEIKPSYENIGANASVGVSLSYTFK